MEIRHLDTVFSLLETSLRRISHISNTPLRYQVANEGSWRGLHVAWAVSEREYTSVELGAVVVVPAREDLAGIREAQPDALAAFENPRPLHSSRMPILGNDVLHPWMERVRKLGVPSLWLTSGAHDGSVGLSALAKFVRQGIERLLVIKLKSYAEMDLADLLRFHCERRNPVTEAHDASRSAGSLPAGSAGVACDRGEIFCSNGLRACPLSLQRIRQVHFIGKGKAGAGGRCTDRSLRHATSGDADSRPGMGGRRRGPCGFSTDHWPNLHWRAHHHPRRRDHRSFCVGRTRLRGGLRHYGGAIHGSSVHISRARAPDSARTGGRRILGRS